MTCPECLKIAAGRGLVRVSDTFVVHGKLETPPVPGWMVIAPATHITQYEGLSTVGQQELGALIGRVAAALRASTPSEKVYVCVFAEQLEHLHVHVIARPPGYAVKGPAIFSAPAGEEQAFDAVTAQVIQRLQ